MMQLSFHLSNSITYRSFTRLNSNSMPSRSGLQSTIRKIKSETLEAIHTIIAQNWLEQGILSIEKLRVDNMVVASNIAPSSDCHLLNDGIRVLSRLLAKNKGVKGEPEGKWMLTVEHNRDLMLKIIHQTERRVIDKKKIHFSEKLANLFEPNTDTIIKGFRDVPYGHKINLSSEAAVLLLTCR